MIRRVKLTPVNRWLEPLLATCVVAALIWAVLHVFLRGYLPQPFFYEPGDTWMDWFNTAYWSHEPGAYDSWNTIYPPLSFVLLRFMTNASCYVGAESTAGRACDWYGAATLHSIFLLNCVLTFLAFRKIDPRTALPRSIALSLGLPMTYGLDRGNLVLLTFTFVLLAYGPLVRSARLRWLFAAMAINLKVYLLGSLFAHLLRRRWRWFEGALITTVLVYLVSFAIMGEGTPVEIYRNIRDFSGGYQAATVLDLWFSGTYKPLMSLLEGTTFPTVWFIGSEQVEFWSKALPVMVHTVQAMILVAAAAAWLRPEAVPLNRLIFLSIAMALITAESGGYTQILLLLFVFMEPWRGFGRKWAIIVSYLLCIAADIPVDRIPALTRESFLAGREVIAEYSVGIGPFIRPALILSLPLALALVTIREVWLDIRTQGWRARRRYLRDFPIMLGPKSDREARAIGSDVRGV